MKTCIELKNLSKNIKQFFKRLFHIHKYNFYAGPFQVYNRQIELGTTMMCKCGKEKNYRKIGYNQRIIQR